MKSTKKREIGLGDNLYGIPLDDILTPEQLEQMRKDSSAAKRRSRKIRRKKSAEKKIDFKKIKLPEFSFTKNTVYITGAIMAVVVLLLIFKNPIVARVAPKLYVSDAIGETLSFVKNESDQIIKGVFGFDLFDKKELTVTAHGGVDADSYNTASDLAMNVEAGYSKKGKSAIAKWQYLYGGEEFVSSTAYLNDEEVGFNVPQLFGEYWTAPAKTFGKEWNESGLRKALYADAVGEDADLSFSNIFDGRALLSAEGEKTATGLTEKLMSSAKAKYSGKTEIAINGESKLARMFNFTFAQADINDYLIAMMRLVLEDSESSKTLSAMGELEQAKLMADDITGRLTDSIVIEDAQLIFAVYKGAVRSIELNVSYAENGSNPRITALLSSESLKNITDTIRFWIDVKGSDKDFSYALSTSGNHTAKGKKFTDTTSVTLSREGYNYSLNSDVTLDFKEGIVSGSLTGTDIYTTKTLNYTGTCTKKGGLQLELTDVEASTIGNAPRTLAGKVDFSVVPDMKIARPNTSNKKLILDYSKAEAENYLMRLEQTDSVKNLIATADSIFKKAE